jgi:hypothetical protein
MPNWSEEEFREVHQELWALATAVPDACFTAAVSAYENARIDGLCHEGAWEIAVETIRAEDVDATLKALAKTS